MQLHNIILYPLQHRQNIIKNAVLINFKCQRHDQNLYISRNVEW